MKFEAGTYYVGDPCYVYEDGWDAILNKTDFFNKFPKDLDGKLWAAETKLGDGGYEGSDGFTYLVDSGLIGIVHRDLMEKEENSGGHMVTFDKPFTCFAEDGAICIGYISIDTDTGCEDEDTCWDCGEDMDWCICDDEDESEDW